MIMLLLCAIKYHYYISYYIDNDNNKNAINENKDNTTQNVILRINRSYITRLSFVKRSCDFISVYT